MNGVIKVYLNFLSFNVRNLDSRVAQLLDILIEIAREIEPGVLGGSNCELDIVLVVPLINQDVGLVLHGVAIRHQAHFLGFTCLQRQWWIGILIQIDKFLPQI